MWGGVYADRGPKTRNKAWMDAFQKYLLSHTLSSFFWCLNPNGGDTGGLLMASWRKGGAGSPAAHVLLAAAPWGPSTHALWPHAARARAVALLWLGEQLSQQPHWGNEGQAVMDRWLDGVMPFALARE